MAAFKVGVLVGSLRKKSFNRMVAHVLMAVAPESLALEIIEIGQLPLYNQDLEDAAAPPAEWVAFREQIRGLDAVLFVTPEYNRSIPAALKNAIDVGSRPKVSNAWNGKPGAVVSVSTGMIGGFGANQQVRQSLIFVNVPVMPQPEAYIGKAGDLFDADGNLQVPATKAFLTNFMTAFADWVATFATR